MEDIKAYIESGILELYVLGDISMEERIEVENMALRYAEVKAELNDIEKAVQLYADMHSVEPTVELQNRVLNSLVINLGDDRNFKKSNVVHTPERFTDQVLSDRSKPTVSIFYKYAFAASLLLFVMSFAALVLTYKQLHSANDQLLALHLQNQKFTRQVSFLGDELSVYRDPSFKIIKLKGTPKSPGSALTVAWNPKKKKLMIDMRDAKLPATDQEHQYQLWAIANGKPIDLGVFDKAKADSTDMKPMKAADAAQAFAVTVEPRGGSTNPTMKEMVVMASL